MAVGPGRAHPGSRLCGLETARPSCCEPPGPLAKQMRRQNPSRRHESIGGAERGHGVGGGGREGFRCPETLVSLADFAPVATSSHEDRQKTALSVPMALGQHFLSAAHGSY